MASQSIIVSPNLTPVAIENILTSAGLNICDGDDPCALPRACKNLSEITGSAQAHIRDGLAVSRFLAWLDRSVTDGRMITELQAEEILTNNRRQIDLFQDISFDPISGAGPHGAIIHYRATTATNRVLDMNSLYLTDSGGQYTDGTTDITRTIAIGTPTAEMKRRYTEVLKGHIALATQRFPNGTTGAQLDTLARSTLWNAGIDYSHGTGHGVGSYLSVHEGPHRISTTGSVPMKEGMIVSNEPGYYKTDTFGIRIENLVVVRQDKRVGDERDMLAFDTLTCVPIDTRPVAVELLTTQERDWLNHYHIWVRQMLMPHLDDYDAVWLEAATRAVT